MLKFLGYTKGMKVAVLYRPNSDHARQIDEFVREFGRRSSAKINLVNLDTREGAAQAALYDVIEYPAILATKDSGELVTSWQGGQLPLIDEVAAYSHE